MMQKLKAWFSATKREAEIQASDFEKHLQNSMGGASNQALPAALLHQITQQVEKLPIHPAYCRAVQSELTQSFEQWCLDADAPNYLVVLGSPMEMRLAPIRAALDGWSHPGLDDLHLLPWTSRPQDYTTLAAQLQANLPLGDAPNTEPQGDAAATRPHNLTVIPDLDWCFLRCIEGLDGINHLLAAIMGDRSRFWLIGCNHWAWSYLSYVCQANEVLEQTLSLPWLSSLELKHWLAGISQDLGLDIDADRPDRSDRQPAPKAAADLSEDWSSKAELQYFKQLATLAQGSSQVAAHLWLQSLHHDAEPDEAQDDAGPAADQPLEETAAPDGGDGSTHLARTPIRRQPPDLPTLPELKSGDRYLLYSLLLHGSITLSHLAVSLGTDQHSVNTQIQSLRRAGLVEQQGLLLWVKPAYYAGLKSDLERNNFLVGAES